MTEEELAAQVVVHLEGMWDIYQEVRAYPGVADIVARELGGPRVWIVETKMSFGLEVLGQAQRWITYGCAHLASVAIPAPRRRTPGRTFGEMAAERFGIGVFEVGRDTVRERVPARLHRRLNEHHDIRRLLRAEHRTHAKAGSARGGYWTQFKGTSRAVLAFVRTHPGCSVKELVDGIEHHYASAKGARTTLVGRIRDGVIKGVLVDEGARPLRLWPDTEADRERLGRDQ